jgi:hypothetical protein
MITTYVLDSRDYESDDALCVDLDNLINEREAGKRKLRSVEMVAFPRCGDDTRDAYYRMFVVVEDDQ